VTSRIGLIVTVKQLGPHEFSWSLVRQQNSGGPAESVSTSPEPCATYEHALDAGFLVLDALCAREHTT